MPLTLFQVLGHQQSTCKKDPAIQLIFRNIFSRALSFRNSFFPHANQINLKDMHFFFYQAVAGICRTPFASTWPASTPSSHPLSSSSATETFDLRGATPKKPTKSQIGSLYCLPADGLSKRRLSIQNEVHSMNEMGFNSSEFEVKCIHGAGHVSALSNGGRIWKNNNYESCPFREELSCSNQVRFKQKCTGYLRIMICQTRIYIRTNFARLRTGFFFAIFCFYLRR